MKRLSITTEELELLSQSVTAQLIEKDNFLEHIKTDEKYIADFKARVKEHQSQITHRLSFVPETYEDFVSRQENQRKSLQELAEKIWNKLG